MMHPVGNGMFIQSDAAGTSARRRDDREQTETDRIRPTRVDNDERAAE